MWTMMNRSGEKHMSLSSRWMRSRKTLLKTTAGLVASLFAVARSSHTAPHDDRKDLPGAEFHLARMIYKTVGGGGSHGYFQPWWAIDYPLADQHFLEALRRMTMLEVAEDSRHLELTDDRIFDYPFLWMQQP